MKLEHKFVVPAPVERTWAAFNDLERVVPCFPGATLTSYDGEGFAGSVKVKVGPVALQYTGNGSFVDRDPATYRAVVEARGKDRRGNGTATAKVTAKLAPSGEAETEVTVDTDLTITGRPAQFGRGLIQEVSDKLLTQFITCLATELGEDGTAEAGTAETAGVGTAGTAEAGTAGAGVAGTAGSAGAGATSTAPPSASVSGSATSDSAEAATLDLGAVLGPAVVKRVAPYVIGAVLALLLRRLFRR